MRRPRPMTSAARQCGQGRRHQRRGQARCRQARQANLSLRQLAELTSLSNPYLSQVERGLHQPSVRVLKAISGALNVSAETLMTQAGLIDAIAGEATEPAEQAKPNVPGTQEAITADPRP